MEETIIYYLYNKNLLNEIFLSLKKHRLKSLQDEIMINNEWHEIKNLDDFEKLACYNKIHCSAYFHIDNNFITTLIVSFTTDGYLVLGVALKDCVAIEDFISKEEDLLPSCKYIKRMTTTEGMPPKAITVLTHEKFCRNLI